MAQITVIDAIMGAGKTTTMFDMMAAAQRTDPHRRFMYIAPYLDEIDRVKQALPDMDFQEPNDDTVTHGKKFQQLKGLVREGRNIASTHECFKLFDNKLSQILQLNETPRYTLIIDETLPVVEKYDELTPTDFKMLLNDGWIRIDGNHVNWNYDNGKYPQNGKFNKVRKECDRGTLVYIEGDLLIWEFNAWFLNLFEQVYICTYMFEGSLMSHYLKYTNHIDGYDLMTLRDYAIVRYHQGNNLERKKALSALITVVDNPNLNRIGDPIPHKSGGVSHPMSSSWFERQRKITDERTGIDDLKSKLTEFFKRHTNGTPSDFRMWTSFKDHRYKLSGPGYGRDDRKDKNGKITRPGHFVSMNIKGTNKYGDRSALAYALCRFLDPNIKKYFQMHDIEAREELFALSEMVQWVFRGRIRNDQPIILYIPSLRMRNLFNLWLRASDQAILDYRLAEKVKGEWKLRDKAVDKVLADNPDVGARMEQLDLAAALPELVNASPSAGSKLKVPA